MDGRWLQDIESLEAISQDEETRDLFLRMARMSQNGRIGPFLRELEHDREIDDETKVTLVELASDGTFLHVPPDVEVRGPIWVRRHWGAGEQALLERTESLGIGATVRLHPSCRADILDLALAGKAATVRGVERDYEGRTYIAVTLNDDPGQDLGAFGHRFFMRPDEVEPL